mmetsp:Transcript_23551/g.48887  ORF Transcript_23551/g.48887 Transcript_23551/m.48887 type:complete len:146 (-) Transcript_23551:298-735(-)|eukprot:CAMPEP_0172451152 /NCGR_PEP_ID=MMETSP1065-20121228/9289_1 /TAXON_ID=265537 /ORGANISM="Amphiprora paludosa, Strain CCMP125" /LENGTH=145 /DNA_ID=CAMNT_0013203063 /DNA_START=118 /DNA_END=555 /DNA_ORIENTATION=-
MMRSTLSFVFTLFFLAQQCMMGEAFAAGPKTAVPTSLDMSIQPIGESAAAQQRLEQIRAVKERAVSGKPVALPVGGSDFAEMRLQQIRANRVSSVKKATSGPIEPVGGSDELQARLEQIRLNRAATRIYAKMYQNFAEEANGTSP